jgi:hypothetical protein
MRTVVGIFTSHADAERAAQELRALGIADEHLNFLVPGTTTLHTDAVPTTDTEQPGMGKALGGVVGGAMGASGGLFGTAIVSAIIPGVGPVVALGLAAAALFGAGGAIAGAAAGGALEDAMSTGIPKDELFVYEDALRQGHTVLIALTDDADQHDAALHILEEAGAESLNAARDRWWVGLLDPEAEVYTGQEGRTLTQNPAYQRGLAAALQAETFGKPYEQVIPYLQAHYADDYEEAAFRRGYERGRAYSESLGERWGQAALTPRRDT